MKLILSLDSVRAPLAGIGRYAYELAKGMTAQSELDDLLFQYRMGWCENPDSLIEAITPLDSGISLRSSAKGIVRDAYRLIAPAIKGARMAGKRDYVYHSPNYALPWFPGKMVSTVHDMSCFRFPEFHPTERVSHMRRIFPHLLKSADLFITVSDFSKKELVALCDVDPDRIVTTYLGKDPEFRPRNEHECQHSLDTYGLKYRQYLLSVSTIEPRKNIDSLIDAYAFLPKELKAQYPLVIVGDYGWNSHEIHKKIDRYKEEGWLKYLAYVPDSLLPILYSSAKAFAYVSHYEGFGLPVLEAMASGIPVIASNVASIPEVGGGAVSYVMPGDIECIRDELFRVLTDESYCSELIMQGHDQANKFTWQKTVADTLEAYKRIA